MSRRAVIKRAKIRRGRKHDSFERFVESFVKALTDNLDKPSYHMSIIAQPVSDLTEEQRALRCAPRITVEIN